MLVKSEILRFAVRSIALSLLIVSLGGGFSVTQAEEESGDYVHYRLGVKYMDENKYEQAVEEFRKVLAAYPDNYNAYMYIAEIAAIQGKTQAEIQNLKKALAYNPGWSKAYRMLASAYEKNKQYEVALKEYQRYQELFSRDDPESVQPDIDRLVAIISGKRPPDPVVKPPASVSKPSAPLPVPAVKTPASIAAPETAGQQETAGKTESEAAVLPETSNKADAEFAGGVASYQKGVETGSADMFNNALAHFKKTLELSPGHSGAYYYAGLIRRRNGQNDMAKVNFLKAIKYPELGFNAHFYLGKIYGQEKNYPRAVEHLKAYAAVTKFEEGKREALELIKKYSGLAAGETATQAEDKVSNVENAISGQEPAKPVEPVKPEDAAPVEETGYASMDVRIDTLLVMSVVDTQSEPGRAMMAGVRQFESGEFDAAIETFKKLLVTYPRGDVAARLMYDIGICFVKLMNYESAESRFQQVIDRYPSNEVAAKAMFFKAYCSLSRKTWDVAERLFRGFIQAYGTHAYVGKAYEKLGDAYNGMAQYKKAVDAFTESAARAASPEDAVYANFKLGQAYQVTGNTQRAVDSYGKAISVGEKAGIFERVPDSYYKIADLQYALKNYEKAIEYYNAVTEKYKTYHDTPWGLFQTGNIHKNRKNFSKAVKIYDELMNNYKDSYWAGQARWKKDDALWENEYKAVLR